MKRLKLFLLSLLAGSFMLVPASASAMQPYFANEASDDACAALRDINPDGRGCGNANQDSNSLVRLLFTILSIVAGLIAVVMIIISGLKYITAQGDANSISSAKQSLIYAIVGLVIVALAQTIVRFVLARSV